MSQEELLWGVGVPALVCGVILLAAYRPWSGGTSAPQWVSANALVAGMVVALLVLTHWEVDIPPGKPWQWLISASVLVAIVSGYGLNVSGSGSSAWTNWAVVAGICGYLVITNKVDQSWAWRGMTAGMMVGAMASLDRLSGQVSNAGLAMLTALAAAASAIVLNEARQEHLSQMAWALSGCLAVVSVLSFWCSSITLGSGGIMVIGMLLPGLAISGYFDAGRNGSWCLVLAGSSLAAYWVTEIPALQRFLGGQALVYRLGAIVGSAAAATAGALMG